MERTHKLAGPDSKPPTPWSYWVSENRLLAGAFPGSPNTAEHRQKIQVLLKAGIRTVINLMEGSEKDLHRRPFAPYQQIAAELCGPETIDCARYAVRDLSIPIPQQMSDILDHIDRSLAHGRPVYVHCWGGVGRTGTVIGCWLLRHALATPDNVLGTLADLRKKDAERGQRISPETNEQRRFVLNWPEP